MKLYIDTETSGVFKSWQRDFHNYQQFPSLLSFAGVLVSDEGEEVEVYHRLAKPGKDVVILESAFRAHGLTLERCAEEGVLLSEIVSKFRQMVSLARMVVGFRVDFDLSMLELAMYRAMAEHGAQFGSCTLPQVVDLAKFAEGLCQLPPTPEMQKWGRYHYKTPTLREAMRIICSDPHEGAHDALADARACIRLHKTIKERFDAQRNE